MLALEGECVGEGWIGELIEETIPPPVVVVAAVGLGVTVAEGVMVAEVSPETVDTIEDEDFDEWIAELSDEMIPPPEVTVMESVAAATKVRVKTNEAKTRQTKEEKDLIFV